MSRHTRPSHFKRVVTGPGEVANEVERKKTEKYAELVSRYQFIPIAIETLGPISFEVTSFVQDLSRRIVAVTLEL
jgi:hypothetical protein